MNTLKILMLGLCIASIGMTPACVVIDDDDSGDEGAGDETMGNNDDGNNDDGSNDDGSNDDGSNDSGAQCSETGSGCAVNGDCCGFDNGEASCIDTGSGFVCAALCEFNEDCASGCCAALEGGGGACAPQDFC